MNNTKYVISGNFKIKGIIDKPDLIGSFFGQTEGLLSENLEFQNLQKNGKIGRIEINIKKNKSGNSEGKFEIPTSLDKYEVSLVAAAIESIKKIGHCEGEIKIIEVKDVREEKRKQIYKRAEEILKKIKKDLPNSEEVLNNLSEKEIKSKIKKYPGEIYGGPNILNEEEIILVEGRADVINLIKNNIENVISFNGSNIPQFIINLTKTKLTTAFLDGDKGGEKELEELLYKAEIDYFCFAPDKKEVEELSYKEIIKSLKNKILVTKEKKNNIDNIINKIKNIIPKEIKIKKDKNKKINVVEISKYNEKNYFFSKNEFNIIKNLIEKSIQENKFYILNEKLKILKEDNISNILKNNFEKGKFLIFNGVCESSILKKSKENNIEIIICKSKAKIKNYENIKVKLFDDFLKDN
jgi:DNA primase